MRKQRKKADGTGFRAREEEAACREVERLLRGRPWLVQGSVNDIAPKSPGGRVTYTWTRKVRAKTVTVALSPEQAEAFRSAITTNREVETALTRLRQASQEALLSQLPGAPKRRSTRPGQAEHINVPNELK